MYKPLNVSAGANRKSSITTTFSKGGINKRDYPQLLNAKYASNIQNYLVDADGRLRRRKGRSLEFTVAGGNAITMLTRWEDDIWVYGYSNKVAVHDDTADTQTIVKGDFTTSDHFSGVKYGDYFFVCNGGDKIGRVSRTIDYDTQTGNYTVGLVVTGADSGATATILEDSDAGATGTLTLGNITGVFETGEVVTDTSTGSAKANGVLGYTYTEITDAPKAKHLAVFGTRLYAGNLSGAIVGTEQGNESTIVWAEQDTGGNPPFVTWTTASTPPTATEPSSFRYRNAGALNGFGSIGSQIVALFDNGKSGFRVETLNIEGTGLAQKVNVDFDKIDFGGERGVATTPKGVFYVNEGGVFQMVSGGQTNVPFSEQESNISLLLGTNFIDNLSFTNSDLIYEPKEGLVLVTCSEDSSTNNLVLVYDINQKSWIKFKGWNIARFMNINDVMYGGDSFGTSVYKLFDTDTDNGSPIDTDYLQELNVGAFSERKSLERFFVQGQLSNSSSITVAFDIFDREGNLVRDKKTLTWEVDEDAGLSSGFGSAAWGSDPFGGDVDVVSTVDSFTGGTVKIANFQRLRLHITSSDTVPHEINLLQASVTSKGEIRRRGLTIN